MAQNDLILMQTWDGHPCTITKSLTDVDISDNHNGATNFQSQSMGRETLRVYGMQNLLVYVCLWAVVLI